MICPGSAAAPSASLPAQLAHAQTGYLADIEAGWDEVSSEMHTETARSLHPEPEDLDPEALQPVTQLGEPCPGCPGIVRWRSPRSAT